jgi:NADPH:quinone reductase-like Zn-dependent oxidoreductase
MERKLEPVISGSFRLGDASQAFAILKSGKARGKLVLNVKDHILEAT